MRRTKVNLLLPVLKAEYENGATMEQLAKKYSCGLASISVAFKRSGVQARSRNIPGQKYRLPISKEEIKQRYERGESGRQIAKLCGTSAASIYYHLGTTKAQIRDYSHARRKYSLNEDYFEKIDSYEKAYWLGFLFADGYNQEEKSRVSLCLADQDIDTIERYRQSVNFSKQLRHYTNSAGFSYVSLDIYNKKFSSDLAKLGCVQAKTFLLQFPRLPKEYLSSFMLGYFDGDGSVWSTPRVQGMEVAGTRLFLDEYQRILMENCQLNKTKLALRKRTHVMRYGGINQLKRIYSFLYSKSPIWMSRKRKKFELLLGID